MGAETAPLQQKITINIKFLNHVIVVVNDVNASFPVRRNIKRQGKTAFAVSCLTPLSLVYKIA